MQEHVRSKFRLSSDELLRNFVVSKRSAGPYERHDGKQFLAQVYAGHAGTDAGAAFFGKADDMCFPAMGAQLFTGPLGTSISARSISIKAKAYLLLLSWEHVSSLLPRGVLQRRKRKS